MARKVSITTYNTPNTPVWVINNTRASELPQALSLHPTPNSTSLRGHAGRKFTVTLRRSGCLLQSLQKRACE